MSHEEGWNFLNSNDYDENGGAYFGSDGSSAYKNADGSGTYFGADGSYGFRNADGTGSFFGEDGSFGMSDSKGSSFFPSSDSEESYSRSTGENIAGAAEGIVGTAEAVANLILLARENKERKAANHSPSQKGHSLALWIFLSVLGFGIPFIIYYSVSKNHYWY